MALVFSLISLLFASDIERQKIDFLLDSIEQSQATFIRNGDKHSSADARGHLEFKLDRATSSFLFWGPSIEETAENFIEHIATKSSTTGKTYLIKFKGKKPQPVAPWLRKQLKKFKPKTE